MLQPRRAWLRHACRIYRVKPRLRLHAPELRTPWAATGGVRTAARRTHACLHCCSQPARPPTHPPQLCEQQLQQVSPVLVAHHVQLVHHHAAQLLQALLLQHAADERVGLLYGGHDHACRTVSKGVGGWLRGWVSKWATPTPDVLLALV